MDKVGLFHVLRGWRNVEEFVCRLILMGRMSCELLCHHELETVFSHLVEMVDFRLKVTVLPDNEI